MFFIFVSFSQSGFA